jgi:predicted permease
MPRADEIGIDPWTLAWTTAIAAATLMLAGLLPSLRGTRVEPHTELVVGGRTASSGRAASRIRHGLTILQIAAASLLLIGGSVLLNSLWNLQQVDLGFDGGAVLTQEMRLMGPAYAADGRQRAFADDLLRRVRAIPGVRAAATTTAIPMRGTDVRRQYPIPGSTERFLANERYVDPAYFDVMRIPLVEGRLLSDADNTTAPVVAVVSESFARTLSPDGAVLGRMLPFQQLATTGPPRVITGAMEIVGIVGDVRSVRVEDTGGPAVYVSRYQRSFPALCLVIRIDPDAGHVPAAVRSALREVDPDQPAGPMTTIDQVVAGTIADRRFLAVATSAFALIALLLTIAGLYGVMVITATERVRELGIRVALGATRQALVAMMLRQGVAPVAAGIALGGLAGSWAMRFITSYLFGVQAVSAGLHAAVATLVLLGGLAACLLPARTASRVDPMQALRSE